MNRLGLYLWAISDNRFPAGIRGDGFQWSHKGSTTLPRMVQMAFSLDNKEDAYISVTVTGMLDKPTTIAAISELLQHPDYMKKHSLWDFTDATMGLTIGDLGEIIGVLRLFKTKDLSFVKKSAFVITGHMKIAMANVYISMTRFLPFEYRVFQNLEEAKNFLNVGFKRVDKEA